MIVFLRLIFSVAFLFMLPVVAVSADIPTSVTPSVSGVALGGPSSASASCLAAPTLIAPADATVLTTLAPSFQIQPPGDPNQTGYRVNVAANSSFSPVLYTVGAGLQPGSVSIQTIPLINNLVPSTTYYWRASISCGTTQGPFSSIRSLTSAPPGGTILPAPTLTQPVDGAVILPDQANTFQWSAVPGADHYDIVEGVVGNCCYFFGVSSTSWIATPSRFLPRSSYSWYVVAVNSYAIGAQSATRMFTTTVAYHVFLPSVLNNSTIAGQ